VWVTESIDSSYKLNPIMNGKILLFSLVNEKQ